MIDGQRFVLNSVARRAREDMMDKAKKDEVYFEVINNTSTTKAYVVKCNIRGGGELKKTAVVKRSESYHTLLPDDLMKISITTYPFKNKLELFKQMEEK